MSKFDPYHHLKVSLTRHTTTSTAAAASGESPQTSGHAALSKDVPLNKTWMRIYLPAKLPSNDTTVARLPIIFYFHGGGWIKTSVADPSVHEHSNRMAAEVPSILIGVEFRLAPAQYEDAAEAVEWVRRQAGDEVEGDQWIRDYGDFSRCYLYGLGCGANVALNVHVHVHVHGLKMAGIILSQPFLGGERRTKSDDHFPLPVGADRDHRFSNPILDGVGGMRDKIGRCLVIGFEGDPLIDRQRDLVKMLVQEGVPVESHFHQGGGGFHEVDMLDSRRASTILNFIKDFV